MMLLITAAQQIHRTVLQKAVLQKTAILRTVLLRTAQIVLQKTVHQRMVHLTAQITHQIADKTQKPAVKTVGFFHFYEYNIKKRIK